MMLRLTIWLTAFAAVILTTNSTNAQNINYFRTFAGGDFRHAQSWSPFDANFPLIGPGGLTDRANFDLGRNAFTRYVMNNVNGVNGQLNVRDDAVEFEITNYNARIVTVGTENGDTGFAVFRGGPDAQLTSEIAYIGNEAGAFGNVMVEDGLTWNVENLLRVGELGLGTLLVQDGASVTSDYVSTATGSSSQGTIIVEGEGATISADYLVVGRYGEGLMEIRDGATANCPNTYIGFQGTETSTTTIDGEGSHLEAEVVFVAVSELSSSANGVLNVQNSGTIFCNRAIVGGEAGQNGEALIDGSGSELIATDHFFLGSRSFSVMRVTNGGMFVTGDLFIGSSDDDFGFGNGIFCADSNQTFCQFDSVSIGGDGTDNTNGGFGRLEIQAGATVEIADDLALFPDGELQLVDGTLSVEEIRFESGGEFLWTGGTLAVEQFDGDLINRFGTLSPGQSAGTTAIIGEYEQDSNGAMLMEVGGLSPGTQHDFIAVTENVILGGQLNVAIIEDFVPSAADEFILLETTAGTMFGTFDNVGDGQRIATIGGEGSFLVRYGITSPNPTRIVLSDFEPACPILFEDGVLTVTGTVLNDVIAVVTSGAEVTATLNKCSETFTEVDEVVVFALGGDDQVTVQFPFSTIYGGSGDDELTVNGLGTADIFGEAGNDTILGSAGPDHIEGGSGNDDINGRNGSDYIDGGAPPVLDPGFNTLRGGSGSDTIHGGAMGDTIFGNDGADTIFGYGGIDKIVGGTGNDTIAGGGGADDISGGNGNDTINGGPGADSITGGLGVDIISGGGSNDTISGGIGPDEISGGPGQDSLFGDSGNDVLFGGQGNDILTGGLDNDELHGGPGVDTATDEGELAETSIEN